jgi:raffinose/stachyose/melibiose transport system permease protein
MNILNTGFSIILPQVGFALPLSVMIFVSFYSFVPNELLEAAVIDGCTPYRIFLQIVFPLGFNTVITIASMYFILIWNDFIFANTFISETAAKTVAIGLRDYVGAFGNVDWGSTFAAIAISVLPPMVIYFALNNKVTAGMTIGATKG